MESVIRAFSTDDSQHFKYRWYKKGTDYENSITMAFAASSFFLSTTFAYI